MPGIYAIVRDATRTYGAAMIGIGFFEIVAGGLMCFPVTAPIGLILGLILAVASVTMTFFKLDDKQKWMEKTFFGKLHGDPAGFPDLKHQQQALQALYPQH